MLTVPAVRPSFCCIKGKSVSLYWQEISIERR
jgi:hypothetical protein